jgi:hypothetical protein
MKKEKNYWIVITSNGIACIGNDDGKIYRCGSPSMVFYPVFENRKDAIRFVVKAKKRLGANWAITRKVKVIK